MTISRVLENVCNETTTNLPIFEISSSTITRLDFRDLSRKREFRGKEIKGLVLYENRDSPNFLSMREESGDALRCEGMAQGIFAVPLMEYTTF